MIAIVDYDAGNLTSVALALEKLDRPGRIVRDPDAVRSAERVIFPGVGAAGAAMDHLKRSGLGDAVAEAVARGTPTLGICLGTQVIFEHSEENDTRCLGILPGEVRRFRLDNLPDAERYKIPQMGWNAVRFVGSHPVAAGIDSGGEFYFVHSYFPAPAQDGLVAGVTDYGIEFASAVAKDSLFAVQFHPEKSGRVGLQLLENFLNWTP